MYITGHKEIIDDALENLPHYFHNIKMDKNKLLKGLYYPDLPCGKYQIIKSGKVIMNKKRLCATFKLYKSLTTIFKYKELFQSHRGILSFLHSMTYDPNLKVKDILSTIITNIAGFSLLSLYDNDYLNFPNNKKINPNIFWIGMILHIVTDSYSQSHTIRRKDKETVMEKEIKSKAYVKFKIYIQNEIYKQLDTNIKSRKQLYTILQTKFQQDEQAIEYIHDHIKDLYKTYKMYKFRKLVAEIINKNFNIKIHPHEKEKDFDIINFQYYNNQDSFYHKKYDLMIKVKKNPVLYAKMIQECTYILNLYKSSLININNNPENHIEESKKFVKTLVNYLIHNTFRTTVKNWNKFTGVHYI